MILTLMLAAGLLAAPEPQAELQKGWVVEIHGYTYHGQAETWKGLTIELQRLKAKPQIVPIESQSCDDLSAFFNRLKLRIEPVDAFYVDDLPALFKGLKPQKPWPERQICAMAVKVNRDAAKGGEVRRRKAGAVTSRVGGLLFC